jgi:F-type H+-transporting ATPase subunit gamma
VELYQYLWTGIYEKRYSRVKIYFSFFKNIMLQQATRMSLFPLNQETLDEFIKEIDLKNPTNRSTFREMFIEPNPEEYRDHIIQYIIENMVYYSILNAKTSEHAARMLAMKNSKDNCANLEERLTRTYNKARQSKITQELTEIVSTKSAIEEG